MVVEFRPGLTFSGQRLARAEQERILADAGASDTDHIPGERFKTWQERVQFIRHGEPLLVVALVMVPSSRGKLSPSAQVTLFLDEVHRRGCWIVEAYTGRDSRNDEDREAMVADAHTGLRGGGRRLPKGFRKRGRPWPDRSKEEAAAKAAWFSPDYITVEAAVRHMPKGWTSTMARNRWGPRGQPWKKRRRKKST